jgi:dTDP-glucose pyrophosphorylase/CBS domain-containing protein
MGVESRIDEPVVYRRAEKVPVPEFLLDLGATVGDAVACIDRSGRVSLALLVDDKLRLINTISDGDVRRGLLNGLTLDDPATKLLPIKAEMPNPYPVTAYVGSDSQHILSLMRARGVRQVPLLDDAERVVDIVTVDELIPEAPRPFQAVVMAGGLGTRLRPLTESTPKPMLPVGGRPVMELIIDQLREVGVRKVKVATHFQAQKIVDHFGDGSDFGVEISYVNEETPLGTGGALGLMAAPEDPVLVINGDILTDVDFRSMHAFHQEHAADMTVAVRKFDVQVPYGVVECEGPRLTGLREKPQLSFFVNAGIYLLEPQVYSFVPANHHFNMTDLIDALVRAEKRVVSFPVREYWVDIGQHADYERAQKDAASGRWRWTGATR